MLYERTFSRPQGLLQWPITSVITAGLVMGLAGLVMLGWLWQVAWMVQIIPDTTALVFSNAFCLFLLAIALLLTAVKGRWIKPLQTLIGSVVLCVGFLVVTQYYFDFALPLDLNALHSWLNKHPGRMALNTAVGHVFAGATVLLAIHTYRICAVSALIGAIAMAVMGITGIVGYQLHPELLYGWHIEIRMALHTGVAFTLLGIGYASAIYRMHGLGKIFRQREDLRIGLLAGTIMMVVGLIGGLSTFTLLQTQTDTVIRNGLKYAFENDRELIVSETSGLIQATKLFAGRPEVGFQVSQLLINPHDREVQRALQTSLDSHIGKMSISGRIFDANDRLLVSLGSIPKASVELPFRQISQATLIWDNHAVGMRTNQAIVVGGVTQGRIELNYALPAVTHMLSEVREFGDSSEMQLCAVNENSIRCLPMRLAAGLTELPYTTEHGPTLIARALVAAQGSMLDVDYRGERVIAVYGPVGDSGLGMVLKVNVAEIYAPLRKKFEIMLWILALSIAAGLLLLRARLMPLVRRLILSQKRFRGLLESAPDAMLVTDINGRILWVNFRAEQLFGYSPDELIGKEVEILVPARLRANHVRERNEYAQHPNYREVGLMRELYARRKDGSEFPVEIGLNPQEFEEGTHVVCTVRDISERTRALQELRNSEQRWQFALEGSRDGVWDWNLQTNEVFYSPQWKRMLGYEEHEITESLTEWDKRVYPEDKARTYADIERHLKGEVPYYQNEHRVLCKDGSYKWILDRGMIVSRNVEGQPTRMIGTHSDISERKQDEETIRELSLVDELTGLRNRRGFLILGEAQLSLARRLSRRVALYFADVDGLKRINDELGHAQGDQALVDFAALLRRTFREADLIARLSGDEFVILVLQTPNENLSSSLNRLNGYLDEFNHTKQRPYRLEVSIGIARQEAESQESLAEFLARADQAMYHIKQQRRAGKEPQTRKGVAASRKE